VHLVGFTVELHHRNNFVHETKVQIFRQVAWRRLLQIAADFTIISLWSWRHNNPTNSQQLYTIHWGI